MPPRSSLPLSRWSSRIYSIFSRARFACFKRVKQKHSTIEKMFNKKPTRSTRPSGNGSKKKQKSRARNKYTNEAELFLDGLNYFSRSSCLSSRIKYCRVVARQIPRVMREAHPQGATKGGILVVLGSTRRYH